MIRRAYLDLVGLLPPPAEVDRFVSDSAPDAYEKLIDKLLASPHYGERWGRNWLDVVRYADSSGFEYDMHIDNAWRYRDYVIKAWNQDKPYNRFAAEQIAGDEMDPKSPDALIATGFNLLGPDMTDAACDARFDGFIAFVDGFVGQYFDDRARRRAWGLDPDPEPIRA